MDTVLGEDGRYWYQIIDDINGFRYYARSEHLRRVPSEEMSPISPDVPRTNKMIEVDLAGQEVRAFEFDELVFQTIISSGIPNTTPGDNGIPTITPSGNFYITRKTPLRHMGDGNITSDLYAYELPGVPWCSFFHITGVAFHGTYWHSDFGRPRSHGCINMRTDEARWLYRWTLPVVPQEEMHLAGYGTPVVVR
jgi:lipoprotein-anchoring transpeptidase ErfK/SrfK